MLFLREIVLLQIGVLVASVGITGAISVERDLSLTLSQKVELDQFRSRVTPLLTKPFMKTDLYLLRWLRARNFDLPVAEIMLKQHLQWRKDNKMDTILKEDWSDMLRDYPATFDTHDKEGRPIASGEIHTWDIRAAVLQGKGPRYVRYLDYIMETVTMQVFDRQAKGMNVTQWVFLGNGMNFNLVTHGCPLCIPLWIQFIQSLENNYNGWAHEFIIVEAPSSISIVMEAVRPFFSAQTRQALRIFDGNRAKWMPYLDARIAKDQRKVEYGGTRPDQNDPEWTNALERIQQ